MTPLLFLLIAVVVPFGLWYHASHVAIALPIHTATIRDRTGVVFIASGRGPPVAQSTTGQP